MPDGVTYVELEKWGEGKFSACPPGATGTAGTFQTVHDVKYINMKIT